MSIDHEKFMRMAVDLASKCIASPDGRPFGAVVVVDGIALGLGMNETVARSDPTAHAEVMAIRDACAKAVTSRLSTATLYASSEPCPLCLAAAMWAGITEIYYGCSVEEAADLGFSDKDYYDQFALPPDKRRIRSHRLLPAEGRAVVAQFHQARLNHQVRGFVSEDPITG
jgi:guanine deaminase